MSESPPILYERQGRAARITLNRPDRLNAFTAAMHAGLREALDRAAEDRGLHCVVIAGAGRGFCAGQDLNERLRPPGAPPVDLGETVGRDMNPLIERIAALPLPVIAAVNGIAAGAGASMALACDLVVAGASARFAMSFGRIGLIPDGGASWALPRLVGRARAAGLILTGEPVSAMDAADWGMIWKCVADEALEDEVERICGVFAAQPVGALAASKQALAASFANTLTQQLEHERRAQQVRGNSADYREGVAAFMEKRAPRYGDD